MSKKKLKAGDIKRRLTDDGEISPFASIKLVPAKEEKKTERKKAPAKIEPKKPSEIVQGYNPSSSFADILYAYEGRLTRGANDLHRKIRREERKKQ